jgi:hypothetical protein
MQWARHSSHRYPSEDKLKAALLYNYQPVADPRGYFDQVYVFPMRQA